MLQAVRDRANSVQPMDINVAPGGSVDQGQSQLFVIPRAMDSDTDSCGCMVVDTDMALGAAQARFYPGLR